MSAEGEKLIEEQGDDEIFILVDERPKPIYCGRVELARIDHVFPLGTQRTGARAIYLALCQLSDEAGEGSFRAPKRTVAERAGFKTDKPIAVYIAAFERIGICRVERTKNPDGSRAAPVYTLTRPEVIPSSRVDQMTPGGLGEVPGGGFVELPPVVEHPPSRAHPRDVAVAVDGRVARDARPSVDVKEKQSSTVPSGGSQSDPPSGPSSSEESFQLQAPPSEAEAEAEQEPLFEAKTVMDNNVQEVWDKFVEVNQPVRKDLSPSQERMLRAALKELTVEEAILCIHGNRLSQWHRERGRHALSDIFKPNQSKRETIRQRADRFIADAVRGGKANQRILSVDRGKVQRHKELVIRAYQPGAGETIRQFGEDSKNWLEEHGIEVRITNDWPRFVEKDD